MLPNLLIIGAQKCGTTSLHAYLDLHPDVHMAAGTVLAHVGLDDLVDEARLAAEHHRSQDKAELVAGAARMRASAAGRVLEAVPVRVRAPVTQRLRAALSRPVERRPLPPPLRERLA